MSKLAVLKNYKSVGKLHGNGDSFESGLVKHFDFENINDLARLLRTVSNNPKYSVCIGTFPRDGEVLPKDKADIGDMTRTKDVVNKGSILVIDNDYGKKFDLEVFGKYWETFKGAGYVHARSGSTIAGKKKHGSHTYFIVKDGVRSIHSAMEILEAICIIEGYCKVEFHKTGKAVVKTPVDKALSQNSRVVYEDDVDLVAVEGKSIDLTTYPKNLKKIMDKAQKITKKMLKEVEDESLKLHKKYVKKFTGRKLKTKKQIKLSLSTYDEHEVDENFKLYIGGQFVGTVGDLVLGRLDDMKYFSDLYEPDYGGGSQKAIYYADTKTFFSQAHGGITYRVKLSDKFNNELIAEFLKEVPYLEDAHDISEEYRAIIAVRDIVEKKRLIRQYAKDNGVTATDVEKELERLSLLRNNFEKFYDLWLRGEYDKTVNPESRLEHLHTYRDTSHMVNIGGKVAIVSTYEDDYKNIMTTINPLDVEKRIWSDRKTTILSVDKNTGETTFTKVDTPTVFVEGHEGDEFGVIKPCKRWTGLDFAPKKDLDIAYNLFRGFPITPRKGDISRWKKHMTKAFGKEHYEFIMDWFADMYQNPDRKCTFAVVVKGTKGCVPCDTEFLTPTGWKRIDEYVEGDLVCEWSPDGSTSFKKPIAYTKVEADSFVNVKNMTTDITLSEGHRVPYITSKGNHAVKSFYDIRKISSYKLPRKFNAPINAEGVNMTDDEIRLLIMQSADGSIAKNKIVVNVKKERKKKRLVELLNRLQISFSKLDHSDGYSMYRFYPKILKKDLSVLWGANEHQMKVIYEEMLHWDGSIGFRKNREVHRFTGNKADADLFQYVASCISGKYVNVFKDKREYVNSELYNIVVSNRDNNIVNKLDETKLVKAEDGFQYCFTTSSSFWLMRQNGRIYPTGNTGKNTFEDTLGRRLLSNENYFRTATQNQLFGKFNSHLMSNLLVVGQEIVWGGSHDYDSILKDMITESTRVIERKGVDSFTINNYSRLYMTSNADWVVPASSDERRFYVASTIHGAHSKADWVSFHKWLKEDGVLEALMYELLNRDLSNFDNVYCPVTKELAEQKHESLYGVARFVVDAFEDGFFGKYDPSGFERMLKITDGATIPTIELYNKYSETNNVKKMNLLRFSRELTNCGLGARRKHQGKNCLYIKSVEKSKKSIMKALNVVLH